MLYIYERLLWKNLSSTKTIIKMQLVFICWFSEKVGGILYGWKNVCYQSSPVKIDLLSFF